MTDEFYNVALNIIEKLSKLDPLYDNDMGDTPCFFCRGIDEHSEDCIWQKAKKIME